MPDQKKQSKQFFQDMRAWQNNQYSPGAFLGGNIPFGLKQFGKRRWFRIFTIIYLTLFAAAIIFGFIQMFNYFNAGGF